MANFMIDPNLDGNLVVYAQQTQLPEIVYFQFGQFHKPLRVISSPLLNQGEIIIPRRITPDISLPNLEYETRLAGKNLFLGPVIGIMVAAKHYRQPELIASRLIYYSQDKGLIYLFGEEQIDKTRQLIVGKFYNPRTSEFEEGLLPYPNIIYLRTNPQPKIYRHLVEHLGSANIYNYPFRSNKWTFWSYASTDSLVSKHLPETRKFTVPTVRKMLAKYDSVYLKPILLSRGRGIYRLSKVRSGFKLENSHGTVWRVKSRVELNRLLRGKIKRKYIAQAEAPFAFNGQKVDFRIYLHKNRDQIWQRKYIDTRIARQKSIITNRRNRQYALPGDLGLRQIYGLDEQTIGDKFTEITDLSIRAVKTLEAAGHSLGDIAVDFILDKDLHPWLLEAQPDYLADKFTPDRVYMRRIVQPGALDYARGLWEQMTRSGV